MSSLAYRQEILAEDLDEAPGALWTRELLNSTRVIKSPSFVRVVVGVDPPGGATECGIVIAGLGNNKQGYIISDRTLKATPDVWAGEVIAAVGRHAADMVVGEANYGGDMVENTIKQAATSRDVIVRYKHVQATRGKAVRAEPIVALFEQGRAHLVGQFTELEDELTMWIPGETKNSPNRLDAMVWAMTELFPAIPEPQDAIITYDSMKLIEDIDL
jgi:phage terminase large subunit-like protein